METERIQIRLYQLMNQRKQVQDQIAHLNRQDAELVGAMAALQEILQKPDEYPRPEPIETIAGGQNGKAETEPVSAVVETSGTAQ